ncbi:MAG: 6,7-dimethyl-8-ribityllumazine synthase [Spirochaetaceae bacterium]|jgi:6,7-dimethyl-8-ribityllumazine synthase|nr:6,7-dimethyl-8-ribityllumazine synthase [Spirochaetaceae bacterium]
MKEYSANLICTEKKWAFVVSRFNDLITGQLLKGAEDAIIRHGGQGDDITLIRVPGAFELPLAAQRAARSGKYNGVLCLGAIIRGATPHFDFVASEAAKGIAQVSLKEDCPISFGVLTTDSMEQALERAGVKGGNKGFEAALAMIEMANLLELL